MKKSFMFVFCLLILFTASATEKSQLDITLEELCEKGDRCASEAKYDSSFYFYNRALSLDGVEKTDWYPKLINDRGTVYYTTGDMETALREKLEAVRLTNLKKKPDLETLTDAYSSLGIIYRRREMQDSALHYYQKALTTAEALKSDEWLANIYNNLAIFYSNNRRMDEALNYIQKAIAHITKVNDIPGLIFAYQVKGSIQMLRGEIALGIPSIKKAIRIATENNLPQSELRCLPGIMSMYWNQQKKDSVMYYIQRGNELLETVSRESVEGLGFIEMTAKLLPEYGRYNEAIEYMTYLRSIPQNVQTPINAIYLRMAECYHKLGDERKAYVYMDSARMWTDSLFNEEIKTQLSDFSAKYETREKELEIARLQQEKLLQEADLMTARIIGIVIIAALIISVIIVMQKRKQIKKNMKLLEKESDLMAARKYIEGLESERKRFAKELHDGVANDLLGLQMKLNSVGNTSSEKQEMIKSVNDLRQNVRNISHELMPPEFEHLNIDKIIGYYLADMQKNYGITLSFTAESGVYWHQIPQETAYEVYRITQELMTNIIKHAGAKTVHVSLDTLPDQYFRLKIVNDGKLFSESHNKATSNHHTGIGIRTIQDRVKSIGATFEKEELNEETIFLLTFKKEL